MATAVIKLEKDENGQTIHLPAEFHLEGSSVAVHREGDKVVLSPVKPRRRYTREEIRAWFAEMDALNAGEVIPGGRNQPPMPEPRDIFKD
ncbi:MAG: hypothetical protein JSS87_06155 [Acidobacteria bacterium]|nr:hypothetical protein [Acidobacteriota bacterium]